MSVDKLVDSTQLNSDLTSVANAIRTKGGTSASLEFPDDFVSAIQAISTGTDVSDTTATESDVLSGKYFHKANGSKVQGTIATKSGSDITASGNTVTIPSGYYASQQTKNVNTGTEGTPSATKGTVSNHAVSVTPSVTNTEGYIQGGTKTGTAVSVSASELVSGTLSIDSAGTKDVTNYENVSIPSGSATTPATTITATPSISVSSAGLITATNSETQSVTPSVTEGYVESGTAGTVTVDGSNTSQLATQAAQTIMPGTSDQTIESGKYLTGAQTIKGDANLVAGNIAKDITIFGVTGTHEGGGGGGGATDGDVIFIDYDGSIVDAKTKAEINSMTSDSDLPGNPSHTGLTAQGWNWTVAQLKAQLTAMPDQKVYVGQLYVTTSGATEIDVEMQEGRLEPTLTIAVNGTITVDWGDNTTPSTVTGTSLTTRKAAEHTYATAGNYTIKINESTGSEYAFASSTSNLLLRKNTTSNQNRVYANCIKNIRLGNGIKIFSGYSFYYCNSLTSITVHKNISSITGTNTFNYCHSLKSITIPNVTNIPNNSFSYCYSLVNISIPYSVTSIGNYAFAYCYSLTDVSLPNSITSIGTYAFDYCYSLNHIIIPNNATSIGQYSFEHCESLKSATVPSGITSFANYMFGSCFALYEMSIPSNVTSIGNSVFVNCLSLSIITIPGKVTSIGNSAFASCYGVKEYHVLPETVPTGGTNMFLNIVSDCVIYVPYSADHSILNAYKSTTNWSTYASYMQEEPQ